MADGLQTTSTNDILTSTKFNKVARRVVIDCTSSTRPGSPLEGQQIYETDTTLRRTYDGSNWISAPLGIIAHDSLVGPDAVVAGAFGVVSGSGNTFACVDGEWYCYEIDICFGSSFTDDTMKVRVQKDVSGTYTDFDVERAFPCPVAGYAYSAHVRVVWHATFTGFSAFRTRYGPVNGIASHASGTDCSTSHLGSYAA